MKNFFRICFLLVLLTDCSTEFNPILPADPTPLIYGVINPQDSFYYIRLIKTFAGEGSAYDMAKIADSIYYTHARVFLETRDLSGTLVEKVELEECTINDRLPGIFATTPNRIFRTDASKIHLRPEYYSALNKSYDLNLRVEALIPGYTDTVHSQTRLRSVPKITQPRSAISSVYFYSDNSFWMQWTDTNSESLFQILVRMHYTDFLEDGTQREMIAEWVLTGIEVNSSSYSGGVRKVCSYYFRPENFYSQVRSVISADPEVDVRVCGKIDFIVLASNIEIENYENVYEIADDYHEAGYTNVENGYGLFSTYTETGVYGLTLGYTELDSLSNGKYTKQLKFVHY